MGTLKDLWERFGVQCLAMDSSAHIRSNQQPVQLQDNLLYLLSQRLPYIIHVYHS